MSESQPAPDRASLRIGGRDYYGWTSIRVTRAIDRMASDFDISVTERWRGQDEPWQIEPFAPVEIRLGEDLVLTGYVDAYQPSYDARQHGVRIAGRSKTEDLIDCTPEIAGGEFRGATLDAIARAICQPFGIDVVVQAPVGDAFDLAALERTETAYQFLERLGRLRGVLLTDDAQGRLVLCRAGEARAAGRLVQGKTILTASSEMNVTKRFSRYIVRGQHAGRPASSPWGDVVGAGQAAPAGGTGGVQVGINAVATDDNCPRYRPHSTMAESALTQAQARERALWQAAFNAGRATKAKISVQGWRQPDGRLWEINQLAHVTSPYLKLDRELLVAGVSYSLGADGRRTELTLGPVQGYTPDPGQVKRREAAGAATGGGNPWGDAVPIR